MTNFYQNNFLGSFLLSFLFFLFCSGLFLFFSFRNITLGFKRGRKIINSLEKID